MNASTVLTMNTTSELRPLPRNTIVMVAGVSFRQEAVRRVVEYDAVLIRHDQDNQHDANACEVVTVDGQMLGYVPRNLTARLAGVTPGGVWRGQVEEVLRGDTTGLRVRLGDLVTAGLADAGARSGGLRHRGDGTVESPDGTVQLAPATEPEPAPAPAAHVYAKSGRLLGELLGYEGSRVHVLNAQSVKATYPAAVVVVRELVS